MNNISEISNSNLKHCEWDSTSAFLTSSPLHVNQYFIQQNTSIRKQYKKDICLCNENDDRIAIDCYGEEMGSFYPGETVSMGFALISSYYTNTVQLEKHHNLYHISCKGTTFSVVIHSHECKNTQFIVTHKNGIWCELFLRAVPQYSAFANIWTDIYTITFLPCPKGFYTQKAIAGVIPSFHLIYHQSPIVILITKLYHVLLTVGYLLILSTTHTPTMCPYIVHLTTAYLTHHTSTSPLLTLNVTLTDLVYCVDNVNKVSVLSLVHLSVNNAPISIY